ncbi:hypothetical protein BN107_000028 [Lactobacillus phage phiAQ113]|uniref:hypothetical protein n=1 Tax=Lactobacillus phage phiAQ113 TaxID=1206110 RepID=UPI00029FE9BC|nr:hypothetical protein BN107_000028 [Lactobacillus phage phiAQ113]CCI88342.1 hypothetical protein BN107_000028 [Lactobacillus phage phiAQ113]
MQQGTIMDTDEVESNNSVIGVSLGFTNKNLRTGYQIRIIGLYVKEEGQENDFLYAVTTAITPEYMPSFADKVLYRFNMQMYLVIGNAQSVNVVINDGTAVTHGQLNKYKAEVTENLKNLENTHKEDMSHVAKSASVNGGAEILPDSTGKLNLVVPDPDLSKYVSLEQLGELLKAKANAADVYTKKETDLRLAQAGKVKSVNGNLPDQDGDVHVPSYAPNLLLGTQSKPKTVEMVHWSANADQYSIDPSIDLSGQKVTVSIKLAKSTNDAMVVLQYTDSTGAWQFQTGNVIPAGNTGYSTVTQVLPANVKNIGVRPSWTTGTAKGTCTYSEAKLAVWKSADLPPDMTWLPNEADKANTSDVYTKAEVNSKTSGTVVTDYDIADKRPTTVTDSYTKKWLVDQNALGAFADQINQLKGNYLAWKSDLDSLQNNVYTKSDIDGKVNISSNLFRQIQNSNNWKDIFGVYNPNKVLTSLRIDPGGTGPLINNYAAGIGFGGVDTKGVLSVDYYNHQARITGGNGDKPVWSEDIAWKSDVNDLRNQVQQLKDNQFEVQTFTDATAAASWEAQRPGKRMAIVNQ